MATRDVFYHLLSSSVIILNIYVAFLFIFKNLNKSITHQLISFVLILLLFRTISIHLVITDSLSDYPHFLLLSHLISRIGISLLFLMVVFEVNQRSFKWFDVFHFTPTLIFLLNFWNIYRLDENSKIKLILLIQNKGYDEIWGKGLFLNATEVTNLRVFSFLIYFVFIVYYIVSYRSKLSTTMKDFFVGITIYMGINLFPILFSKILFSAESSFLMINLIGFSSTFIVLIYFFMVPNLLYHKDFKESLIKNNSINEEKNEEFSIIMKKVEKIMEVEKVFTEHGFSVIDLAERLAENPKKISQAIKILKNQNFNQFINEYRVYYFLELVKSEFSYKQSIIDLSYKAGFNSPNNFYIVFKSILGCTPKEYINSLKK